MKFTVSFFKLRKIKKEDLLEYFKGICVFSIMVIVLSSLVGRVLKSEAGTRYIIGLASDFSKRDNIDIGLEDIVETYPVFNASNYTLAKTNVDKKPQVKQEVKSVATASFDVKAVDAISILDVFKKPNLKITKTSSYERISIYGITMLNYSSNKEMDYESLFKRKITLTKKSDPLLIYCTHTSESYANSDRFKFNYSGIYRSRDSSYNMLSVASVLNKTLIEKSFKVVFDTTPHDYTSYENSYKNSRKTIQKQLDSNSNFGMVIDVHRDASGDLKYAPTVEINGRKVAQLMIVMGVGTKGYENKYWSYNLSLAVQIMRMGEKMYPGLFKPMIIRGSKYNQDMSKNSFLIEVGATGNTLEEAYYGARCLANILSKIYI